MSDFKYYFRKPKSFEDFIVEYEDEIAIEKMKNGLPLEEVEKFCYESYLEAFWELEK